MRVKAWIAWAVMASFLLVIVPSIGGGDSRHGSVEVQSEMPLSSPAPPPFPSILDHSQNCSTGTTVVAPPVILPQGAELLIFLSYPAPSTFTGISDTAGNTFNHRVFTQNSTGAALEEFYLNNAKGSPKDIVTMSYQQADVRTIMVVTVSAVTAVEYQFPTTDTSRFPNASYTIQSTSDLSVFATMTDARLTRTPLANMTVVGQSGCAGVNQYLSVYSQQNPTQFATYDPMTTLSQSMQWLAQITVMAPMMASYFSDLGGTFPPTPTALATFSTTNPIVLDAQIYVMVQSAGGNIVQTVTDSLGNQYRQVSSSDVAGETHLEVWIAPSSPTAGPDTISATLAFPSKWNITAVQLINGHSPWYEGVQSVAVHNARNQTYSLTASTVNEMSLVVIAGAKYVATPTYGALSGPAFTLGFGALGYVLVGGTSGAIDGAPLNIGPHTFGWTTAEFIDAATVSLGILSPLGPDPSRLSPPYGLSVKTVGFANVTLQWHNPPGNLINDTIYYGPICGKWINAVSLDQVASTTTVSGLPQNFSLCFAVQAWIVGLPSPLSTSVTATTGAPFALGILGQTATSIFLGWANPVGRTVLNTTVYYGAQCGIWAKTISTAGFTTVWNVTGLAPSTTYCFAVQDWDNSGASGLSNNATGTTLGAATPGGSGGGGGGGGGLPPGGGLKFPGTNKTVPNPTPFPWWIVGLVISMAGVALFVSGRYWGVVLVAAGGAIIFVTVLPLPL